MKTLLIQGKERSLEEGSLKPEVKHEEIRKIYPKIYKCPEGRNRSDERCIIFWKVILSLISLSFISFCAWIAYTQMNEIFFPPHHVDFDHEFTSVANSVIWKNIRANAEDSSISQNRWNKYSENLSGQNDFSKEGMQDFHEKSWNTDIESSGDDVELTTMKLDRSVTKSDILNDKKICADKLVFPYDKLDETCPEIGARGFYGCSSSQKDKLKSLIMHAVMDEPGEIILDPNSIDGTESLTMEETLFVVCISTGEFGCPTLVKSDAERQVIRTSTQIFRTLSHNFWPCVIERYNSAKEGNFGE